MMNRDSLKYKMLVTDMDYTLLNKEKRVSDRNREALRRAMEKGVHMVVATGRIYTSARIYAKLLGLDTPIIASNGALIKDASKTIFRDILSQDTVREMLRLCHKYGIYCHFFTENTIYSEKLINVSLRYTEWNKYMGEEDQVKIRIVDDGEEIIEAAKSEVLKAVVFDDDDEKIQKLRDGIMETGIVSVSQSMKHNLEVMNKGVTKGNAVRILAQLYGINREEVIAIGDNENDISMIEYAGLGIAMGNAEECLKRAADHVTGDYQEDGVAEAIEKFIL
ncbi:MAG TPA: Cof-type HAD-IIB family hydrolase [Bacillota bacterium]|nr:Cof-type HAD-IIB family hydrolase [Bacillota bacterium]HPX69129.1 Cof-type HAD-IIB family hydrolase [Bacillota bacterium]